MDFKSLAESVADQVPDDLQKLWAFFAAQQVEPHFLKSVNPNRKWELASTLQKAIRRQDYALFNKATSALSMLKSDGRNYAWRRLCVTAAEDIGPANPDLVWLAIEVHRMMSTLKAAPAELQLIAQLALGKMMIDSPRSRDWTAASNLQWILLGHPEVAPLGKFQHLMKIWKPLPTSHPLVSRSWATEGISQYVVLDYPWEPVTTHVLPAESTLIAGLPTYAYDIHTRVGKIAIATFLRDDPKAKDFRASIPKVAFPSDYQRFMGYALFYAEGGRIFGTVMQDPVWEQAEKDVISASLKTSRADFMEAIKFMAENVSMINNYRRTSVAMEYPL